MKLATTYINVEHCRQFLEGPIKKYKSSCFQILFHSCLRGVGGSTSPDSWTLALFNWPLFKELELVVSTLNSAQFSILNTCLFPVPLTEQGVFWDCALEFESVGIVEQVVQRVFQEQRMLEGLLKEDSKLVQNSLSSLGDQRLEWLFVLVSQGGYWALGTYEISKPIPTRDR